MNWLQKISYQTMTIDELKKYIDPNVSLNNIRSQERSYLDNLKRQISQNGIQQPLQLKRYNNTFLIWDGNHRLAAAEELGIKELPVIVVD